MTIILVLAVFGGLAMLAVTMTLVLCLVRRRRRLLATCLTDLDRAVLGDDGEAQSLAKLKLRTHGWSPQAVDDEIARLKRRHSQESGVSLAYLMSDEFLKLAQRLSGKEDPTFYDLKTVFFFGDHALGRENRCPRDGLSGCALVDWLPRNYQGRCTHFLSWTWGYRLSVVRGAMEHWLEVNGDVKASEVILYMCFFVNNQYRILADGSRVGSEDLGEVFEQSLARIGKVIAVLDTWDCPTYLTRIWTIFEQVVSIKLNVPVTMVLPKEASLEILKELERGKEGIIRVKNSLTKVDSARARASVPEDERAVKELISRTIGFHSVDEHITDFMIKWIGIVLECHMRQLVVSGHSCGRHGEVPQVMRVISSASVQTLRSEPRGAASETLQEVLPFSPPSVVPDFGRIYPTLHGALPALGATKMVGGDVASAV